MTEAITPHEEPVSPRLYQVRAVLKYGSDSSAETMRQPGRYLLPVGASDILPPMKEIARLLGDMAQGGIIINYALFGAMAQMRYMEPVATLDADVLVATGSNRLDVLAPFCAERGYPPEGEVIRVGDWPLQFIPAFDPLTREAVEHAEFVDFDGTNLKVVRADYLAVIALSIGRPMDFARILALIELETVMPSAIKALARKHGLQDSWRRFEAGFKTIRWSL